MSDKPTDDERMNDERTHWPQIIGSIVVALAIVAIAISITTAKFGTTSSAEIESREERLEAAGGTGRGAAGSSRRAARGSRGIGSTP